MSKEFPKAQRAREDLILDFKSKHHVKAEIVQYLASHQISGLRFLYKNYKNNKSCFLNDESGLGKTFQMVAFLSAVCSGAEDGTKVLILCQNPNKLLHWQYHCSVLLPKVNTIIADNQRWNADAEAKTTASCIIMSSMDNALTHSNELKLMKYRFVIVHDEQLEVNFDALVRVRTLIGDDSRKVIICSADVLANTRYFYQMLKFCDLRLPLFVNEAKQFWKFNEFNMKFGGAKDGTASKRNLIFRQKNLLNVCHDFYLRRFCHQSGGILPLVDPVVYEKCFNQWKTSQAVIGTIESSWFDDDMEVPASQGEATETIPCVVKDGDPSTSAGCDEYESQMSPLVYQSSESDVDAEVESIKGTPECIASTSSKKIISKTKEPSGAGEITGRTLRSQNIKRSLRSSNRKRPTEPTLRQRWVMDTENKAKSKQKKKVKRSGQPEVATESSCSSTSTVTTTTTKSSTVSNARKSRDTLSWSQDTCASDIQFVQEEHMTPITISSTPDSPTAVPNENSSNTNFTTQASPDMFGSFTECTEAASIVAVHSSPSPSPIPAGQSRFASSRIEFDSSDTLCTQDIFADSQDIASTTNPVGALCTTPSDIFEITRNNVFHNVLRVDTTEAVTPVISLDSAKSCFSGVRVVLPRLKSDEILEMQKSVSQHARNHSNSQNGSSQELIDLTADSQLMPADVEKTPQRKRPLTPSTRSCVRRPSGEIYISSDDETPSKTPTRSGWLSKRTIATSPQATPRSRRQLEKWFPSRTSRNNSNKTQSVLQPRNIFQTNEPNQMQRLRTNSRPTLGSPSIFSSDDE